MSKFGKLLAKHQKIENEIFSAFGLECTSGEIDMKLDMKWNVSDSDVYWCNKNSDYGEYACELHHKKIRKYENFVLMYVDNGCGDHYYMIFDEKLRDPNLELE